MMSTTTGITKAHPLMIISLQWLKAGPQLETLLEKNISAKRVCIELRSEGQCGVLMHDRKYVVQSIGEIATRLKNLTHVVIDFSDCVHCNEWFVHCDFPIEALGKLFQARADTLVSLGVDGQDSLKLEGSQTELSEMMEALQKAQKLQELDLSKLCWEVIPEIHMSRLPREHASDIRGHVIDPNGKPLDVTPLLKAIHSLSALQTFALRFYGCEFQKEGSILQDLVADVESLKLLSLCFYIKRESGISNQEITKNLNGVLETALPYSTTLENLQVKSGFGTRGSGLLELTDNIKARLGRNAPLEEAKKDRKESGDIASAPQKKLKTDG